VGLYDFGGADYFSFVKRGATFTTLEEPDAVAGRTQANGINDFGVISGDFENPPDTFHGFVLPGSNYTTVDFPFADSTIVFRLNNSGTLVGDYAAVSPRHAFVYQSGNFLSLDVPDSERTIGRGINALGEIVGRYRTESEGRLHGFIATPKSEQ